MKGKYLITLDSLNISGQEIRASTNFLFVPRACPGSLDLDLESRSGLAEA